MKWFEKAVGREKIIHLFDGDLELKNLFLDTVLCYDYKLDLVFYLFDLPTNFPEKWQKSAFNAIKINLEFFNLDEIHFYSKGIQLLLKELEENSEGRAQTLDLDLRLNLSTRKKLRDHEYEVRVFRIR